MFRLRKLPRKDSSALVASQLYDDQSFYPAFTNDVRRATGSIIIESPFITYRRLSQLTPLLKAAAWRGVHITINTCDPQFHEGSMQQQAAVGVQILQDLGATVLFTGNLHRKLVIIDERIFYEGSLNVLSQSDSCEIMRRVESEHLAQQLIDFADLRRWYTL